MYPKQLMPLVTGTTTMLQETALRLDVGNPAVYVNLGILELESGNPAAGAAYFAEAVSLDPESAPARQGLAEARQLMMNRESAS